MSVNNKMTPKEIELCRLLEQNEWIKQKIMSSDGDYTKILNDVNEELSGEWKAAGRNPVSKIKKGEYVPEFLEEGALRILKRMIAEKDEYFFPQRQTFK